MGSSEPVFTINHSRLTPILNGLKENLHKCHEGVNHLCFLLANLVTISPQMDGCGSFSRSVSFCSEICKPCVWHVVLLELGFLMGMMGCIR